MTWIYLIVFIVPAAVLALSAKTFSDIGISIWAACLGFLLMYVTKNKDNPKVKRWLKWF